MDKRIAVVIVAVLAFFAGAIWVSEVPVVATLVAFLECLAGFGLGFYFKKLQDDAVIASTLEELSQKCEELDSLKAQKSTKTKKATKVKES